jgi:tetratricopeptide (TPR) repeat protein
LFDQAARLAEARGDDQALGEAALGASGFWLYEQRSPVAQARLSGWWQAAIDSIDPTSLLALRLRVRQAAEHDYESGETQAVLAALAEARGCGDRAVLAEALHLAQHCLLGPKFAELRLMLGDELMAAAAAADDPFEACRSLLWQATNRLLTGHPHADRALVRLRTALAEHQHLAMSYVVSAVDVMFAIRAGAFDRAEQLAVGSAELGRQAGDPDALGWYGAHLVTIRFFQGKGGELLPMLQELVASPELSEPNDAFLGALATAASMAGDSWTAASALRRLCRPNLAALRHNSIWIVTIYGAVLAARLLGDKDVAAEAYELLIPFADLPVTGSFAVTCLGPAHYPLAVAAATLQRWDVAAAHFRQSLAASEALGHRPAHVLSEAGLGEALAATGETVESARCLARAQAAATALGMDGWCARWAQYAPPAPPAEQARCLRHGTTWLLSAAGRQVTVPDSLGVRYLATLLGNPGTEISALDLVQQPPADQPATGLQVQEVLDEDARRAYRQRITELQEQIDAVGSDPARAEAARTELDWLLTELGRATGLAGRSRGFPTDAERARSSVQKAIRRALARIEAADPEIRAHLEASIVTGVRCSYRPIPA